MFILDTNIVCELRNVRSGKADARVARWADAVEANTSWFEPTWVALLEPWARPRAGTP